jgi:hypothetical protein
VKRTVAVVVMVCGALASVATDRAETSVSSVEGREVMDTGVEDCSDALTLCVTAVDADGLPLSLVWVELYDPDGNLIVEEDAGVDQWCVHELDEGEHLVVAELSNDASVSGSAVLDCTLATDLELVSP